MRDFKTIGIVVKTGAQAAHPISAELIEGLQARGLQTIMSRSSAAFLQSEAPAVPLKELGEHCDLVIAMGGDGTLLGAGRAVAASGIPLLGINLGRLGFMVDIAPQEARESLDRVLDGDYVVEKRLALEARPADVEDRQIAINDVVVRHQRYVRMLDFSTYADGLFISQHRADGIIASTPTGSTAYALSSGGPMMHPNVDAIAMVPISPHTLSDRPLIVPADSRLEIEIGEQDDNGALFTCDGQVDTNLAPGARLEIRRSPHGLNLIHLPGYDYFGILRNKLKWGSNRNNA